MLGSKDELVLRVLLLRQGNTAAMSIKEEQELKNLIKVSKDLIFAQRNLKLYSHVYRKRTYSFTATNASITVPLNIHTEQTS